MARTIRQALSEVTNDLRALNIDDWVPPKYVYYKLVGFNARFIKMEADKKKLARSQDMWLSIPCLEMRKAAITECCEVDGILCKDLMKSVKPIPDTYTGSNGDLYRDVAAVDFHKFYTITTVKNWNNIQKREMTDDRIGYAFIYDKHLFIPNSSVEIVSLVGAFINPTDVDALNNTAKCCDCNPEDIPCKRFLDYIFNCPEYLWEVVKQETVKDLFSFYKRTIPDENPNLDNNDKTKDKNA